jgi:hypothetical protein
MTTTTGTPAQPVTTCPPSSVVDMIVYWDEVRAGDLVLWDGSLRVIESWMLHASRPDLYVCVRLDGLGLPVQCLRESCTAVRRYTEGPSEAGELRAELARQLQATRDVDDLRMTEIGELRARLRTLGLRSDEDWANLIAALDEAADDRSNRAGTGCRDCAESPQRHCEGCQDLLDTAGEYRELRDELTGACRGA